MQLLPRGREDGCKAVDVLQGGCAGPVLKVGCGRRNRSCRQQARVAIPVQVLCIVQRAGVAASHKVLATWRKNLGSVVMGAVVYKLYNWNIPGEFPRLSAGVMYLEKLSNLGLLVLTVLWGMGHLIIPSALSEAGHLDTQVRFLGRWF